MIKEVIRFRLPLGPATDEFTRLLREVMEAMGALGVEPGISWIPLTDSWEVVLEREFDSLAQYEADDSAFHRGEEIHVPLAAHGGRVRFDDGRALASEARSRIRNQPSCSQRAAQVTGQAGAGYLLTVRSFPPEAAADFPFAT